MLFLLPLDEARYNSVTITEIYSITAGQNKIKMYLKLNTFNTYIQTNVFITGHILIIYIYIYIYIYILVLSND